MNQTIKKWAESLTGKPFVRGEDDCHWICVDFLELATLTPPPEEIIKYRGTYSTWQEAHRIAKEIDYDEMMKLYGYEEVEDQVTRYKDIVRIDHPTRSYALLMPVLYGRTVMWCKKKKLKPVTLDELAKPYRVYRRV